MKKSKKLLLLGLLVILIIILLFLTYVLSINKKDIKEENSEANLEEFQTENDNISQDGYPLQIMHAVILRATSSKLAVMETEGNYEKLQPDSRLFFLNLKKEDNTSYKRGQEILIYFDGGKIASDGEFGPITGVEKIEILKEQTDISIPDEYLEYYNEPTHTMKVDIQQVEKEGIKFLLNTDKDISIKPYEAYEVYRTSSDGKFLTFSKLPILTNNISMTDTISSNLISSDDKNIVEYVINWRNIYGNLSERILWTTNRRN